MTAALPDLEAWIKAGSALVAVLMAILVPVRSWIVEDRRYRAQTMEALASVSRATVAGVITSPTMLADALAISALAEALSRVAAALEGLLEQDERRGRDRLKEALERLLQAEQGR